MNFEFVTLVLKHSDISTDQNTYPTDNNVGTWSNGKQSTTWRVNMRQLLGDKMYDENEIFSLNLKQIAYTGAGVFYSTTIDKQVIVTLSGLNFVNSNYDIKTGNNSNYTHITSMNINDTQTSVGFQDGAVCNFRKSNDYVNLTIELIRTVDGLAGQSTAIFYPHSVYSFIITPVK